MKKYKVVGKIVINESTLNISYSEFNTYNKKYLKEIYDNYGFIGYKVIAGLYIFYITPDVYEQCIKEGIVSLIDDDVHMINMEDMLCSRGITVYHRMVYALQHSTVDYLRTELYRVNQELCVLDLKIYRPFWYEGNLCRKDPLLTLVREIRVDLKNEKILKNIAVEVDDSDIVNATMFKHLKSYEDFLDILVTYQDREYMNSRNIIDKYRDSDFYSVDNWNQRLYKFEFSLTFE